MRGITFPYKTYRGILCPIVSVGLKGSFGWIDTEAYVDSGAFLSIYSLHESSGLGLASYFFERFPTAFRIALGIFGAVCLLVSVLIHPEEG